MIVIKVNYTTDQPIIKVNYDDAPIYISTSVDATYINVDYGTGGGGGGGAIWGDIIGNLSDQLDLQAALDAKVPYTGATGDVDLGEYELKAGQIELDQSPTGTAGVAVTRWNDTIGSTETTLKGGNVVLKNGVDLVARIVNKVTPNTTLTKAAYQAVRISGAQGQRLAVAFAQANNDNNSADTIGLVTETIATNQEGFIMTVGSLEGINTTGSLQGETWADGDVLYLSPTVAGAITNVKPIAPQHLVVIGYVEYAHANNGKIYVKVMNGWELGELHDVDTTGATNGQVLKYNGSIWTPQNDLNTGTVTSVDLSAPTGFVVSGNPITSSGTLALSFASGYSLPTTVKQGNWDDAYTFVSGFPSQTGNSGKYLTTDGSTLSWGTVSTANIYTADGTLTGNRTVSMSTFTLTFAGKININTSGQSRQISTFYGANSNGLNIYIGGGGNNSVGSVGDNTLGSYNTALGVEALNANTTGQYNTGIGVYSLRNNTTGYSNSSLGTSTLQNNLGGYNNAALGVTSMQYNTSGYNNAALGEGSLLYNTTGYNNVSIGGKSARLRNDGTVTLETNNNSIFIGFDSRGTANGNTNEIVIASNGRGLGSNTTVIGNSSTTDTAIYGRMLVNYGTPVIGTYALDVNGTTRFKGDSWIDSTDSGQSVLKVGSNTNVYFTVNSLGNVSARSYTTNAGNTTLLSDGTVRIASTLSSAAAVTIGEYTAGGNFLVFRGQFTTPFMFWSQAGLQFGNNANAVASALVEFNSTTKGFLPPRMTAAQKTAISTPATGLVIYQTDSTEGLYQYKSTGWEAIGGGGTNIYNSDGTLTGNRTITRNTNLLIIKDGAGTLPTTVNYTGLIIQRNELTTYGSTISQIVGSSSFGEFTVGDSATQIKGSLKYTNTTSKWDFITGGNTIASIETTGLTSTYKLNIENYISSGEQSGSGDIRSYQNSSGFYVSLKTDTATNKSGLFRSNTDFFAYYNTSNGYTVLDATFGGAGIDFNTQGTTRARLFSTGNLTIGGTTDAGYKCDIQGTARVTGRLTTSTIDTNNASVLLYDGGATNMRYGLGISPSTLNIFAATNLLLGIGIDQSTMTTSNAHIWMYSGMTRVNTTFDAASYKYIYATESISSAITASFGSGRFHNSYNAAGTTYTQYPILSITRAGESGVGYDMSASFGIRRRVVGGNTPKTVLDINVGETAINGYPDTTIMSITGTGISINNTTLNGSAILQADSTTKGFLPPRMTETQKNAISTPATGLVIYQTDGTEGLYQYKSTGWSQVAGTGGGGGISRSVNVISTTTTAGASASTDYVYLISGTTTLTLPTAVGNTNRYTLKNVGTNTVTINTTSSQTIDGSTSITMAVRYTALDVISDGTNWNII